LKIGDLKMKRQEIDLTNQVAIITGAARGLGKEIAKTYSEHGARVVLVDILEKELKTTADKLKSAGHLVLSIKTDITDPGQVEKMVEQVLAEWKQIDILVNNAATFSYIGPVWEAPPEKWFTDVRVSLYGAFLCCRSVVKHMVKRKSGYILNTVSSGGTGDPHPHATSYATSKAALMRLTEGLAQETEEHNIKVFALAPPAVLTDMTKFILEDQGGRKWRPQFKDIFTEGKDYPPQAVAEMALQLVSGKANKLTGRFFEVKEGFEEIIAREEEILRDDLLTLRITGRIK
jgi:NAD(P)-dependent dehydrogenase (short-subunit alcohol dehydrogenase family)